MKIKRGSVSIPIFPHTVRAGGRKYKYHRLVYFQAGKIQRPIFKKFADAKAEADRKAIELSNGVTAAQRLSEADAASFARARQILEKHQIEKPLELVVAEWCEAVKPLAAPEDLKSAIEFYRQHHHADCLKPFAQIADEFLVILKARGKSSRHFRNTKNQLGFLKTVIQCPLSHCTAAILATALDTLQKRRGWSNRSRNHCRTALIMVCNHAWRQGDVPREWDAHKHLVRFDEADGEITIDTPEIIRQLFDTALLHDVELIPAMVLLWFCGLRTSEVCGSIKDNKPPQDWRHVDFQSRRVFNTSGKVRKKSKRYAYLPPNGAEWLKKFRGQSGAMFTGSENYLIHRLKNLEKLAGIVVLRNSHRHTAISVRVAETDNIALVSRESGTSIPTLEQRYVNLIPKRDVKKYRAIRPLEENPVLLAKIQPKISGMAQKSEGQNRINRLQNQGVPRRGVESQTC